jgi:hypothetical protein
MELGFVWSRNVWLLHLVHIRRLISVHRKIWRKFIVGRIFPSLYLSFPHYKYLISLKFSIESLHWTCPLLAVQFELHRCNMRQGM